MRRSSPGLAFALALGLGLAACTDAPGPLAPELNREVPAAGSQTTWPANVPPGALQPHLLVSADWLAMNLRRQNVVVLHFGSRSVYDDGHIPGARFLDLDALQPGRDSVPMMLLDPSELREIMESAGVSTSSHVIVYGDGVLQGARGFFMLDLLGHPRVSLLDGGRTAWLAAGGTLSREEEVVRRGSMWPLTRGARLVDSDWILQRLDDHDLILVDARPAGAYAGTVAPTPTQPRPGHIPGAWNMPWAQLVRSGTDTRLKEPEDLRALFASTGARVRSPVVAYCTSGMMSSVTYFAARYLGYDVMLYDGSWFDWSLNRALPAAQCPTRWC
jgi:thiosulfate/3-mercaptopyruvate sulfurtransferase